jgi:hypothetical protein
MEGDKMRQLIERIESLVENKAIVIATKEVPDVFKKPLKEIGYKRSSIGVTPIDSVSLQGFSGDGYRSFAVVLNLDTGKYDIQKGSFGGGGYGSNDVDTDNRKYPIPRNGAVIVGEEGGGQPVSASVYVNPDTVAGFLPEKSDLTDRQKSIIRMMGYTSSYKKELMSDNKVSASEVDELIRLGYIKKTSAGATSLTIKGKNARD